MQPLTLDDLLPLEEFVGRRREFFDALTRYLDRYRRVRVGPQLTFVFENRQTLWFRAQEFMRIARLTEPDRVQEELDAINRLLPGRERLHAALLIEVEDETRLPEALEPWNGLRGEAITLRLGPRVYPAELAISGPEDRCLGVAHWTVFAVDNAAREALADFRRRAYLEVAHGAYHHRGVLTEDVRQSLTEDLGASVSDRG